MGSIVCSTESVKAAERFSYWQEVTCRAYVDVDCVGGREGPLEADISQHEFGQMKLSRYMCAQPMQYFRREEHLRADAVEDFQFVLLLDGCATVTQGGREARLKPGDMVMYEASRPFHLNFPQRHQSLGIKLARPLVTGRLAAADHLTAHVMDGTQPVAALASSLLRQAYDIAGAGDPVARQRLSASMLDMLTTSIEVQLGAGGEATNRRDVLLGHVKSYMIDRIDDPDLSIDHIARAQNVAPRTIHRLFATEGTTAMRWLLRERLNASYRALAEGRIDRVTNACLLYTSPSPRDRG